MGTMLMTAEEVGAYIRLLCWQWEQGGVPSDPAKITRIAGVPHKRLDQVLEKFDADSSGILKNFRMEEVRTERENFLQVQRANGTKGGRPKRERPNPRVSQTKPMGYDRVTIGLTQTEPKKTLPVPLPVPSPLPFQNTPLPPEGDELELDDETKEPSPPIKQPKSEHGQRIHAMFNRRESTPWSDKELKALRALEPIDEEDFDLVEDFYLNSGSLYLRRDVLTFLNNFQGEVDRVKAPQAPKPETKYHGLNPQRGKC